MQNDKNNGISQIRSILTNIHSVQQQKFKYIVMETTWENVNFSFENDFF